MAKLRAIVQLQGKDFKVISSHFEFSRKTDSKGRPITGIAGGRMTLTIESDKDTSIVETMLNYSYKPLSGRLIFYESDDGSLVRAIDFRCAYLVHYKEDFYSKREQQLIVTFTFSADIMIIGDALLNNSW